MKNRDAKQKEEIDELKEEMSILKKFEEEFEQEIYEKKKFAEEISEMTDDPKVYDLLNEKMSLVRKMERESESVLSEAYDELKVDAAKLAQCAEMFEGHKLNSSVNHICTLTSFAKGVEQYNMSQNHMEKWKHVMRVETENMKKVGLKFNALDATLASQIKR